MADVKEEDECFDKEIQVDISPVYKIAVVRTVEDHQEWTLRMQDGACCVLDGCIQYAQDRLFVPNRFMESLLSIEQIMRDRIHIAVMKDQYPFWKVQRILQLRVDYARALDVLFDGVMDEIFSANTRKDCFDQFARKLASKQVQRMFFRDRFVAAIIRNSIGLIPAEWVAENDVVAKFFRKWRSVPYPDCALRKKWIISVSRTNHSLVQDLPCHIEARETREECEQIWHELEREARENGWTMLFAFLFAPDDEKIVLHDPEML